MEKIIKELEQKFGKWNRGNEFIFNCSLTQYFNGVYLNAIFDANNEVLKILKQNKVHVGKSLSAFYKKYGGLSLFCHSFVIYGWSKMLQKGYSPLNIEQMNSTIALKNKNWNEKYYSIGNYLNYEFCLKKYSLSETVYVINKTNLVERTSFKNIDSLIEFAVQKISPLYKTNGLKSGNESPTNNWMKNMCEEDIF